MPLTYVVICVVAFAMPIVALMARHQQKMAEILQRQNVPQVPSSDPRLVQQVSELRELILSQSQKIDDLTRRHDALVRRLGAADSLEDRLNA